MVTCKGVERTALVVQRVWLCISIRRVRIVLLRHLLLIARLSSVSSLIVRLTPVSRHQVGGGEGRTAATVTERTVGGGRGVEAVNTEVGTRRSGSQLARIARRIRAGGMGGDHRTSWRDRRFHAMQELIEWIVLVRLEVLIWRGLHSVSSIR